MAEWGSTHRASLEAAGVTITEWSSTRVAVERGEMKVGMSGAAIPDSALDQIVGLFEAEPAERIRWAREVKASRHG